MSIYRIDDVTVNTANAQQSWTEAVYHDGHNLVSKATGDQWKHETLRKSRKGRYYLEHGSDWQGSTGSAEFITEKEAAAWLIFNEHELPEDLAQFQDEVSE